MKFQLHLSKLMQRANMKKVNCKSRTYFPSIFLQIRMILFPFHASISLLPMSSFLTVQMSNVCQIPPVHPLYEFLISIICLRIRGDSVVSQSRLLVTQKPRVELIRSKLSLPGFHIIIFQSRSKCKQSFFPILNFRINPNVICIRLVSLLNQTCDKFVVSFYVMPVR